MIKIKSTHLYTWKHQSFYKLKSSWLATPNWLNVAWYNFCRGETKCWDLPEQQEKCQFFVYFLWTRGDTIYQQLLLPRLPLRVQIIHLRHVPTFCSTAEEQEKSTISLTSLFFILSQHTPAELLVSRYQNLQAYSGLYGYVGISKERKKYAL